MQRPNISGPHVCSFCPKSYGTLQALGGHMTCHRDEMEQMRSQHEAFMKNQRAKNKDIANNVTSFQDRFKAPERFNDKISAIPFTPLPPNVAYWEGYKRFGVEPWEINFLHVRKDFSSDFTKLELQARQLDKMQRKDESSSKVLDLTLKL